MKTRYTIIAVICYLSLACGHDDPTVVDPKTVFTNKYISPDAMVADGKSTVTFYVELPLSTADARRIVNLKASKGIFLENGKDIYASTASFINLNGNYKLVAKASLQGTNEIGDGYIALENQSIKDTLPIKFKNAFPDDLILDVDKLLLKSGYENEITISPTLVRKNGIPSAGNIVSVKIIDANGVVHNTYRKTQSKSDSAGKTSFIFSIGNDTYTNPLTVIASSVDSLNQPLLKTINIQIQ
jgi:hypothetical protein